MSEDPLFALYTIVHDYSATENLKTPTVTHKTSSVPSRDN